MEDIAGFDRPVQHRGPHPGRSVRAFWSLVPILSSALVLGVGIAGAADNPMRDPRGLHTITVIDPGLLLPGALTIRQGEALEFANYTSDAIRLVFIEPKDSAEEVRCGVGEKAAAAAGSDTVRGRPVFVDGPAHRLTVIVPPGRYSTACSLTPGRYAFVTSRLGRDPRSPLDALGLKGTISVE
jgi:hypothetical protein